MEIIVPMLRNILDQEDLLLFENHCLNKEYKINNGSYKNTTRLMLLVGWLNKYTEINDIIKIYLKYYGAEINAISNSGINALDICVIKNKDIPCLEAIKILLEYGTNINQPNDENLTSLDCAICYFNYDAVKLMLEYDGIKKEEYLIAMYVEIELNINLLNKKN